MQLDKIEYFRLENLYSVIRFEGQRNSKNAAFVVTPDHEVYMYYSTRLKSPLVHLPSFASDRIEIFSFAATVIAKNAPRMHDFIYFLNW